MLGRGDPTERWKEEQRGRGMWEWIEGQNVDEQQLKTYPRWEEVKTEKSTKKIRVRCHSSYYQQLLNAIVVIRIAIIH